jgi:hypothetical protein
LAEGGWKGRAVEERGAINGMRIAEFLENNCRVV